MEENQKIMPKTIPYDPIKLERLKNPDYAKVYLEAALEAYHEDGDRDAFLTALRDIVKAQVDIPKADNTITSIKSRKKTANSVSANLSLEVLDAMLSKLGFHLSVEPISKGLPFTK